MELTMTNSFFELTDNEVYDVDGGSIIPIGPICTSLYIVSTISYNIKVAEINAYNDTVTSNGRSDLVQSYPIKPKW